MTLAYFREAFGYIKYFIKCTWYTPPYQPLTLATLSLATIYIYIYFLLVLSALLVSTTMLFVKLGSAMTHELLFMRGVARDWTENVHEIKSRRRRQVKCPAYHNVLAVVCGVIRDFLKKLSRYHLHSSL